MLFEQIHFQNNHQALKVHVDHESELPLAVNTLELISPVPVVVLVGGAAGVNNHHAALIQDASNTIAQVVENSSAALIDGGTQSGVMASIGQVRTQSGYKFPLIGVAVEDLVTFPGHHEESKRFDRKSKRFPLDPHHSHFILVPGTKWGGESPWISQTANVLSGERPSVTILVNGGEISREDVANSLRAKRPVVVLRGTGRLADELAMEEQPVLIRIVSAEDENAVYQAIEKILRR